MKKTRWELQSFLAYVLATQVVLCITLVLDTPIVRQVVGFLYLILIPGFIILRILRLDKSDVIELILFSVGLSIAFLMFIGLLINESGSAFFISRPLSTEPLAITISITVILMCTLSCLKNRDDFDRIIPRGLRTSLLVTPYLVLPFLGVIGVLFANAFENNLLLLLIIIAISILFLLSPFSPDLSPYHLLAIVSIASTLLLTTSFASNYIHGYDIHKDYFVFEETKNISYWDRYKFSYDLYRPNKSMWAQIEYNVANSMLSITVLPTIFSNILNMTETWTFKIVYPLIFSLVPLALYQLYQRQWGKKMALLSALFCLSNEVFFYFRNSAKQMVAELFYVLLFLVLLKRDMNETAKWIILVFFSFALIVSHYTMNFIFLFLILSMWIYAKISGTSGGIRSSIVFLFFVLTLSWYTYIVNGPFDRMLLLLRKTFMDFIEEFLVPQSRGSEVLTALGVVGPPSFLHSVGTILHNATEFFILAGFITLVVRRKKERLDPNYFSLTSMNMVLLLIAIVTPFSKIVFSVRRLYHIALLFLSPLFILGGRACFESVLKILPLKKNRESYSLFIILTILVAFFLFQTGFVYEVSGDPVPSSVSLSKYRMDEYTLLELGVVNENDFFGAAWLSKYANVENTQIYTDVKTKYIVLTSSMINRGDNVVVLYSTTRITSESYIYLSRYDIMNGFLLYDESRSMFIPYNISELSIFNSTIVSSNRIYSNNACEIYYYIHEQA